MSATLVEASTTAAPAGAGPEESELAAFNAAFDALDLDWHWDRDLYRRLPHGGDDRETLIAWLRSHRPHLLTVYDLTFLCDAVLAAKRRYRAGKTSEVP